MNGQTIINAGAGLSGAFLTFAFGGWSEAMTFLLVLFVVDIVSGVNASIREGRGLSSAVASIGAAKKGLMLLVIIIAHRADILLGLDSVIAAGATFFYIANELLSVIENYGRAGLPIPDRLKQLVTVLRDRAGDTLDDNVK
ncbi:phage holin family protein [Cohnella mopanensis]|uniref:phage holin family protein n=1 Tax=Cohnella mopanensis TaxID=2911966 RepID=UPI001EF7A6E1|nr:phage holin family protein [Cohnella mopanensis]